MSETRIPVYAHRFSYELHKGPVFVGLFVLHRCDNPICVNPRHLFLGTNLDNQKDKLVKGRQPHGQQHWNAKLTDSDIIKIRQLKLAGIEQRALAERFHVSQTRISVIVSGRAWRHVE